MVGFDKHPPGAFNPLPEDWGLGSWYGETGLMLTTQFFAMKIQRYMAEHGISDSTLAKVASKAFDNGARNPNAWRRRPLSEEEVLASKMVNHPLTQYMFCSPGEGAVALVLARGERAQSLARTPIYLRSVAFRTRRFGSFEVYDNDATRQHLARRGVEVRDVGGAARRRSRGRADARTVDRAAAGEPAGATSSRCSSCSISCAWPGFFSGPRISRWPGSISPGSAPAGMAG